MNNSVAHSRRVVEEICGHFEKHYLNSSGLIATTLDVNGKVIDERPIISDFGDILPFLFIFGQHAFVTSQIHLSKSHLWHGLFRWNGRIDTFHNHDFLLGLLDLYEFSNEQGLLEDAIEAADTLWSKLRCCNRIIDSLKTGGRPDFQILHRSNPFNGGYIELFVKLFLVTGREEFRARATIEARSWVNSLFFRHRGLFGRLNLVESESLTLLAGKVSPGPLVRLFKDNTNLVYSLVALYKVTKENWVKESIFHWISGFKRYLLNDGAVFLYLDRALRGSETSIKAAFPTIDLLCDIYWFVERDERFLSIAVMIADYWLGIQWSNGLFPLMSGARSDHLDCNTDMSIALTKLAQLTQSERYLQAARRCARANLATHCSQFGYVLSVDPIGGVVDDRIFTKYQSLLLKVFLLEAEGPSIYGNERLFEMLKDR